MNINLMAAAFALKCDPRDKNLSLFWTAEGGRQTSNLYRLLLPLLQAPTPVLSKRVKCSNLSLSRVPAWVSPQEIQIGRKPSGVSAVSRVGKQQLQQLQQLQDKLKGKGFKTLKKRGGQ